MSDYKKEDIEVFLKNQLQLLPEEIAETIEEAEEFLEDCCAVVCSSKKDVRAYFEDAGLDIYGMNDDELFSQPEVFKLSGGRYLIVEA